MREEILARQIEKGISPKGTKLTEKPKAIPNWDDLTEDEKTLFKHQAEVFAAYIDFTDHHVGRLIKAIEEMGELDNTLIFFVYGDNGTSAEGGRNGMFSEMTYFNGVQEKVEDMLQKMDKWGGPETYPHMAAGWAVMFDSPYKWTKQMGSDYGGTKVGMAVHWPKGIKAKGELRNQFHHVIDVAPTILEAAGLPEPVVVNSVKQVPMAGTSMLYSFNDANAPDQHTQQYFEMFGNRAMYKDGWLARTIHRAPWEMTPRRPLEEDIWELYNTKEDFSLSKNLSQEHPDKLKELQDLFMSEGEKYHVLPIDDRVMERIIAENVGRPDIMEGRTSITLAEGMTGMTENTFPNIKNTSLTITAEVEVPEDGGHGIIIAQGGRFGGWALYMDKGMPCYDYNFLGMQRFSVTSDKNSPPENQRSDLNLIMMGAVLPKAEPVLSISMKKKWEGAG
jgi:arylsulfatase